MCVHRQHACVMFLTVDTAAGSVCLSMLGELHGHISSVRALAAIEVSQHQTLLFSGGGRASVRAWLINTAGLMSDGGGKNCS